MDGYPAGGRGSSTHGRTSSLFSSIPGASCATTRNSNVRGAEAIVRACSLRLGMMLLLLLGRMLGDTSDCRIAGRRRSSSVMVFERPAVWSFIYGYSRGRGGWLNSPFARWDSSIVHSTTGLGQGRE